MRRAGGGAADCARRAEETLPVDWGVCVFVGGEEGAGGPRFRALSSRSCVN